MTFFPGGKCELEGQFEAAANIQRLLETARDQAQTIVYVRHEFKEQDAPFAVEGTAGAEIHDMVKPLANEPVVIKSTSNIFLNNNLKQILDEEEVEQLVICGSMSKDCIAAAAHATTELGYPITIIYDACATRERGQMTRLHRGSLCRPRLWLHFPLSAATLSQPKSIWSGPLWLNC